MQSNNLVPASENQLSAVLLLKSPSIYKLIYGGARSGKTAITIDKQISMCYQFPGSRHAAGRSIYNHARTSLFHDTIQKNLSRFPGSTYNINKSDSVVYFANGSELWVVGFDSEERIEKFLGHEYATVYFNEASQIAYDTFLLGVTRLAQNIPGLKNRAFVDCNPPSPAHWLYKLFILKIDPKTEKPLQNPELYESIRLNPVDNEKNLPSGYIKNVLENLPERDRKRFLHGEFCKMEGTIYNAFDETEMYIDLADLPPIEYYIVGIDNTGNNLAAILIGFAGDCIYILDEHTAFRQTMSQFNADIYYKWAQYKYIAYADPASGALINELSNCLPAENAIQPGINLVQTKIEHGKFKIVRVNGNLQCPQLRSDLSMYRYDDKGRIVKENDHCADALRYGIYSHSLYGGSIL